MRQIELLLMQSLMTIFNMKIKGGALKMVKLIEIFGSYIIG